MGKVELTWKNLTLKTNKNKKILDDVSGQIEPGKVVAIIGPSGSGKTTLLNCLSGRIPTSLNLEGTILANGRNRDIKQWPSLISYVNQEFFALENQTIFETLFFAASGKLPEDIDIEEKVNETIKLLSLEALRDSYLRTLSGGEKMKVSIGVEFVGDPAVLFLDEPTSGLDSTNALNILEILNELAKLNKTIVMTIHQPSYKMLQQIDSIILMAQGSIIFFGSLENCIDFFEEEGFKLPLNTNPSDFFLDTIALNSKNEETMAESNKSISILKNKWKSIVIPSEPTLNESIKIKKPKKYFTMFNLLVNRERKEIVRNTASIKANLFQKVVIGCLFAFTNFRLGITNANIFSLRGVISFIIIQEFFSISGPILNQFGLYRKVLERERMSGFYNGIEAYYAKFSMTFLYIICLEIPYLTFIYYVIGLNSNFGRFIIFLLIILLSIVFSISFALTVGVLSPDVVTSQIVGVTINVIYILYGGGFNSPDTIPAVLRWLIWLSPAFYTSSAAFNNQLEGQTVQGAEGDKILDEFGLNRIQILPATMILLGIAIAYQVLGALGLEFKVKNNLKIKKPVEEV